jgi:Zn-dependent protease with chaperone function
VSFALLGAAAVLAALAWAALVLSAVTALVWHLRFAGARRPEDAAREARAVFRLRALPSLGGLAVAVGLVLPAFMAFEPRDDHETPGWPLLLLATAGALLLLAGLTRGLLAWRATRRLARAWLRAARPLALPGAPAPAFLCDHPFPPVALLGVRRPRLFVSRRALELLEPGELQVVLAHEAGHLAARDHLRTLLLRACPDLLALHPLGRHLVRGFMRASEMAADDHACGGDARRAVDLASALVKLGRLAPPAPLPLPAFTGDGDSLAERVERLLAFAQAPGLPLPSVQRSTAPPPRNVAPSPRLALVSTLLAAVLIANSDLLRAVHHAMEHAVHFLR